MKLFLTIIVVTFFFLLSTSNTNAQVCRGEGVCGVSTKQCLPAGCTEGIGLCECNWVDTPLGYPKCFDDGISCRPGSCGNHSWVPFGDNCRMEGGGMGGGMGMGMGMGMGVPPMSNPPMGNPMNTPPPVSSYCAARPEGPYCDCVNNTAYTYNRMYPWDADVCPPPEYVYTSIIDCGSSATCSDAAYSSCSCIPNPGTTPTPTPPPLPTPSTPTPPPVTPTPTWTVITSTPTPPPSIACDATYGTCGCRPGTGCRDGVNTDFSCCRRSCTGGGACITVFGGGSNACDTNAECTGSVVSPTPTPVINVSCMPIGPVTCGNFYVGRSSNRTSNAIDQRINSISENDRDRGVAIPVVQLTEGDVLYTKSDDIRPDTTVVFGKRYTIGNGGGTCYERADDTDWPNSDPDAEFEYCRNMQPATDKNIRVIDGNRDTLVSEIFDTRTHRRIFRQEGEYALQYEEQGCNGIWNSDNKCLVNVKVNKLCGREDFCTAIGEPGNCINVDGQTTLNRGDFIRAVVHYHERMFPAGHAMHWVRQNPPSSQRHFKDVCPWSAVSGGEEGCVTGDYYSEVETAAYYGFLNPMYTGLNNHGNSGYLNTAPILAVTQDWLRDFRGMGVGGDWNGVYDNSSNQRLSLALLRRLTYDYAVEKGHWSCTPSTKTISGYVYLDNNKDGKDTGESPYTGGNISIYHTTDGNLSINQSTGEFTITDVTPNKASGYIIRVFNAGLPTGFGITYPSALQYNVRPGTPCDVSSFRPANTATKGNGTCVDGNIENLNFGITQSLPWVQFTGLDVRVDGGLNSINSSIPPKTVANSCTDAKARAVGDTTGYSSVSSY